MNCLSKQRLAMKTAVDKHALEIDNQVHATVVKTVLEHVLFDTWGSFGTMVDHTGSRWWAITQPIQEACW